MQCLVPVPVVQPFRLPVTAQETLSVASKEGLLDSQMRESRRSLPVHSEHVRLEHVF